MSGDGMELPLRGNMQPSIPPSNWVQAPPRRRTTLADLSKEFQKGQGKAKPRYDLLAILIIYTMARILANLFATDFDFFSAVRPVITGLGIFCFISPWSPYSSKLRLHVLSWRAILCLAAFLFDESIVVCCWQQSLRPYMFSFVVWEISCNVLQVCMTTLKIRALGWHRVARCCDILVILGCGSSALYGIWAILNFLDLYVPATDISQLVQYAPAFVALVCNFATIFLQSVSLLAGSCKATAQAYRRSDAAMVWTAVCLVVNAILVVAGPALSWCALFDNSHFDDVQRESPWVTIDICLQVLNALLLSGMIGAQDFDLKEFRRLAEVSGFGLASNRVAFPGKINPDAKDCIVSFPGKYSAEWDAAVQAAREETSTCSLACVFLTDTASGLGQHATLPDKPEECWCHVIYGYHPASAYLSIVDVEELQLKEGETEAMVLAFKEKDAKAMGQCLLIKRSQTELEWQIELAEALVYAEQLCYKNKGRAPWGCMWFEAWRRKVEEAVRLKQKLHVFYFKDQCGKGKLAWNQLCDTRAKEAARKDTGLGASQTAEVAYLEKEGIAFEQHDISAFTKLIAPNLTAISCDR